MRPKPQQMDSRKHALGAVKNVPIGHAPAIADSGNALTDVSIRKNGAKATFARPEKDSGATP